MKNLATIFLLFSAILTYGQTCLEFSSTDVDYLQKSPAFLRKHHITKIIQREYLELNFEKVHMLNIYEYNDSGYVTKIISSDPKLGDEIPNDGNFASKTIYDYELIDSFLYQKEMIVRRFNQYGKLSKPDTLSPAIRGIHNVYNLKHLFKSGSVYREYDYDEASNLQFIRTLGNYGNIIKLTYDSNFLEQVEYYFTGSPKIAFQNKTVKFKYNANNLISESQVYTQDERQNWVHKYYYDTENKMIKKESWIKGELISILTFEYISK